MDSALDSLVSALRWTYVQTFVASSAMRSSDGLASQGKGLGPIEKGSRLSTYSFHYPDPTVERGKASCPWASVGGLHSVKYGAPSWEYPVVQLISSFVGGCQHKSNLALIILFIADDLGFWRYRCPSSLRRRLVRSTIRRSCCRFESSNVPRCGRGLHWHLWQPYPEWNASQLVS